MFCKSAKYICICVFYTSICIVIPVLSTTSIVGVGLVVSYSQTPEKLAIIVNFPKLYSK